jgi:hypothetical protein
MLNRKIHNNFLLQHDWKKFGASNFEFVVLYMGKQWQDPVIRRGKELELIILDRNLCTNVDDTISAGRPCDSNPFFGKTHSAERKKRIGDAMRGVPNDLLGRKISIDNISYASIAEASCQTNHSRKLICDRVNSELWPSWFEIK